MSKRGYTLSDGLNRQVLSVTDFAHYRHVVCLIIQLFDDSVKG